MVDIPFPLLTAPGREPQSGGGRLINCYPEPLPAAAGKPYAYWRVPGLKPWGDTGASPIRGMILVNDNFFVGTNIYAVIGTLVYSFPSGGGAGTALLGTVPGTSPVTMARNNLANTDVAIVAVDGSGVWNIIPGSGIVTNYPPSTSSASIGSPNSVVFHKSFFIFTYPEGKVQASLPNSTDFNTLNYATAESRPDKLFRAIPLGNGQLLLCGANTMEVWGGANATGFPFSFVATITRGIVGSFAIAGHEDGFGKGIFFVGDDWKVSTLSGYTPTPISVPDLDLLIEKEPDKTAITVSCYVSGGHGMVAVKGATWCWEYDTTLQQWHERQSDMQPTWRALYPIWAFDKWICGDSASGNLASIDTLTYTEFGQPLPVQIDTGPLGAFPKKIRINAIELYLTKGVGLPHGSTDVTHPTISVSVSKDGGQTWSTPRVLEIGAQNMTDGRVRASIFGQAQNQGVRWRFQQSAPLSMGFMGAEMQSDTLR